MKINLLYFAAIRESVGYGSEALTLSEEDIASGATVATLCNVLRARNPVWNTLLADDKPVKFAVNQEYATAATRLSDNCEVAIFPPVTGG